MSENGRDREYRNTRRDSMEDRIPQSDLQNQIYRNLPKPNKLGQGTSRQQTETIQLT